MSSSPRGLLVPCEPSATIVQPSHQKASKVHVKVMARNEATEREADISLLFSKYDLFVGALGCEKDADSIKLFVPVVSHTLLDYLTHTRAGKPLSNARLFRIMEQIAMALQLMHHQGYVHKDLKLENIDYQPEGDQIKLADFGLSRRFQKACPALTDNEGSLHYASPELWLSIPYEGPEVDVWAFGVCIFLLATGYFPFGGTDPQLVFNAVQQSASCGLTFPPGRFTITPSPTSPFSSSCSPSSSSPSPSTSFDASFQSTLSPFSTLARPPTVITSGHPPQPSSSSACSPPFASSSPIPCSSSATSTSTSFPSPSSSSASPATRMSSSPLSSSPLSLSSSAPPSSSLSSSSSSSPSSGTTSQSSPLSSSSSPSSSRFDFLLRDLICKMLAYNKEERISLAGIFQHPFFVSCKMAQNSARKHSLPPLPSFSFPEPPAIVHPRKTSFSSAVRLPASSPCPSSTSSSLLDSDTSPISTSDPVPSSHSHLYHSSTSSTSASPPASAVPAQVARSPSPKTATAHHPHPHHPRSSTPLTSRKLRKLRFLRRKKKRET